MQLHAAAIPWEEFGISFTLRAACPECVRLLTLATVPTAQAAGEISTFGMHGADSPRL